MSKERIDIDSYFESGQYTDYESFKEELQTGNDSKMFVPANDGFKVYDPQSYEVGTVDWFEQMKEEGYGEAFEVEDLEEYHGLDVTVETDNTFNYESAAPLSNHVQFDKLTIEDTGEVLGVFRANISEDVRGAYTDGFILKFEDEYEFTEAMLTQMEVTSFEYEDQGEVGEGTLKADVLTNEIEAEMDNGERATFEGYMEDLLDDPQSLKQELENDGVEVESITKVKGENEQNNDKVNEIRNILNRDEPEL